MFSCLETLGRAAFLVLLRTTALQYIALMSDLAVFTAHHSLTYLVVLGEAFFVAKLLFPVDTEGVV